MNILEIKTRVRAMLEATYSGQAEAKSAKDTALFEQEHFMRKQDTEALCAVCKEKNIFVSFRDAGEDTLLRIAQGHPCKGHKIMDKSIKISGGEWTYQVSANPALGATDAAVYEQLRGFVGHPYIPRKADGSVDQEATDRKPRAIYNSDGKVDRLIYYLDGVYVLPAGADPKRPSDCEYAVFDARTVAPDQLRRAYTGDYDMHDLIVGGTRPLADTPEEHSAIDTLNKALFKKDAVRQKAADYDKLIKDPTRRTYNSPYALIRHGAQTSFFDFLLSSEGDPELTRKLQENLARIGQVDYVSMLPFGNTIVRIAEKIAMFDNKGKIYLLEGVGQIYTFYEKKGLLDQIPFYNFFDVLHGMPQYKKEIEEFAAYINALLSVNRKLIDHTSDYPWRG